MYAIAIKSTNKSSWKMYPNVYDDREKCDNIIAGIKALEKPYKVQRVFFDENV